MRPEMIEVVARAVTRRPDAYEIYLAKLRPLGFAADGAFFTQALWQRGLLPVSVGARILGRGDAGDWRVLLKALRDSNVAMDGNVLSAALNAPSEEVRTQTVWYLVHGYAFDPRLIPERVRAAINAPSEAPSLREAFGRELVRRMLGGERKDDARDVEWLQTEEADALIGSEVALFEYFTDKEFAARKNHCDIASNDCRVSPKNGRGQIPSQEVAQPAFLLPDVLPPGLADRIVSDGNCTAWLNVARARVDAAGRVQQIDFDAAMPITKPCERVVSTLMRLSLASTTSMAAPRESGNLLLVRPRGAPICLDEPPLGAAPAVTRQIGDGVTAPIVQRRVEPQFPDSARRRMSAGQWVIVTIEATVSTAGCVRNLRLLEQAPFPDLNAATLIALAQWRFVPGRLHGEPVDVLFHLTVRFKV